MACRPKMKKIFVFWSSQASDTLPSVIPSCSSDQCRRDGEGGGGNGDGGAYSCIRCEATWDLHVWTTQTFSIHIVYILHYTNISECMWMLV